MNAIIKYKNFEIRLKTNDIILYHDLRKEYNGIFEFVKVKDNVVKKVTLNIYKDFGMYKKYLSQIKNNKNKICYLKYDSVVVIDNESSKVFVIYDEYTHEKLEYVKNILLKMFEIIFEFNGYFLLHAACVSKNSKGLLILEENSGDRIPILLRIIRGKI